MKKLLPGFWRRAVAHKALSFRRRYDMLAAHQRVSRSMVRLGISQEEINDLFGIDSSLPVAEQVSHWPAPSMAVFVSLSDFLGVSVPYLLRGSVESAVDRFVAGGGDIGGSSSVGDVEGGSVLQGVTAENITVHGGGLTRAEAEFIDIVRRLTPMQKLELLNLAVEMDSAR